MECWPRNLDITDPKASQYAGWPKTIRQWDNYGRRAAAYLPTLKVRGISDPVVQKVDQRQGEIVYTLRIKGQEFRPEVFSKGAYTVRISLQDSTMKELKDIQALEPDQPGELAVEF